MTLRLIYQGFRIKIRQSEEFVSHKTAAFPSRIVIDPSPPGLAAQFNELWEYRELIYFLVWRDVKVRYKQTVLGIAWAVLQPLATMVVFTIFFGKLGKIDTDGIPYPIFSFTALLPWQLFAFGLSESSNSLVSSQNLIKKVYFPRLIVPLATIGVGVLDFLISFVVLLGMMVYYGITPSIAILTLPLFLLLAVLAAFGMGLWLSALNVKYRDVRYTIPFISQLWLFATPVIYSTSQIDSKWWVLYGLNPMASVVEGFRWAVLGRSTGLQQLLVPGIITVLVILVSGFFYFRRTEQAFADLV
jgi:lipopolysaccharide transport system permease protein